MITGNVPPLRPLRPFPLIAGLMAHLVCGEICTRKNNI